MPRSTRANPRHQRSTNPSHRISIAPSTLRRPLERVDEHTSAYRRLYTPQQSPAPLASRRGAANGSDDGDSNLNTTLAYHPPSPSSTHRIWHRSSTNRLNGPNIQSETEQPPISHMPAERPVSSQDMHIVSNNFSDSYHETSYQLDSSKTAFPAARRVMLQVLAFQLTAYLLGVVFNTNHASISVTMADKKAFAKAFHVNESIFSMADSLPALNRTMSASVPGIPDTKVVGLLWMFSPFAAIFVFFSLSCIENSVKLRFGVYAIRRYWKAFATLVSLLWSVGGTIYFHELLMDIRSTITDQSDNALPCASKVPVPNDWFEPEDWNIGALQPPSANATFSLEFVILVFQSKAIYSVLLASMALFTTVGCILLIALRLDFPHASVTTLAIWITSIALILPDPPLPYSNNQMSNMGPQNSLLFICILFPTLSMLLATYSEDRAARLAYASKFNAERLNTTLKHDLTVNHHKQLENPSLGRHHEPAEALASALHEDQDEVDPVLLRASIPFYDLELKSVLSSGTTGDVLLADYYGSQVVLKRLALSSITKTGLKQFAANVAMLAPLRHPNIVQFLGATFDNLANVALVMEHMDKGDVWALLRSRQVTLSWSDPLLQIATDAAKGIAYLHNQDPPLVHRDIKSSNLLVSATFACKVSDFDNAKRQYANLVGGFGRRENLLSTIIGTPYWLAPEILREEKYDAKVDCYSFGIVLVELETKKDPYADAAKYMSTIDIMDKVAKDELRPTLPESCPPKRRELIRKCLDNDPDKRPPMTEILESLQHEVRQEVLLSQSSLQTSRDERRVQMLKRHQRLNKQSVRDLLHEDML